MKIDLEKAVMAKVKSNEISMKPRWYFIAGSFLAMAGLIGFSILAIFLTNLTLFSLRQHGPMGQWKLQLMLTNFSWWIPIFAILGIVGGIWLLKKYDFSYKKSFWFIIFGFIISIILAAFILDHSGLNDTWSRQGPMRRLYQKINNQNIIYPKGQGQGRMQNGQNIYPYNQSQ
ncbi:MAG: hypothetical protein PHI59_09000 [Candidatus Omnitrophica bacterium]|nr:hypothetical protein [Candidatus Omnitrophota bacterium]